jgi:MYXO-CTERM domain-containing protein
MKRVLSLFAMVFALGPVSAFAQTADLGIRVDPIRRGSIVDAVITVSNAGPDAVFNADVAIQYDTDLITSTQSDDGCSPSSIGLTCSFATLEEPLIEAGQQLSVGVTFDVGADDAEVVVTVASGSDDLNPGNDTASFSTALPDDSGADAGEVSGDPDGGPPATTTPADEGCCATTGRHAESPFALLVAFAILGLLVGRRRRRAVYALAAVGYKRERLHDGGP